MHPLYRRVVQPYRFSITWGLDFTGAARAVWTAPSEVRCGDLVLLYEARVGGGRGAFVAIGRVLTDAVRAYSGDQRYWVWIDWRPVKTPLPLQEARKLVSLPTLRGSAKISSRTFTTLAKKLSTNDPPVQKAMKRWEAGSGFPRTDQVPIRDLVLAAMYDEEHESRLYPGIAAWHADRGWRPVTDDVKVAIKRLRGPLAFDPDGGDYSLRPDILLRKPVAKRLLVIEVKRAAVRKQGYRNPADQVLDYAKAIRKAFSNRRMSGWTIQPLLAAEEFSPLVIDDARSARAPSGIQRIECREWDGSRLDE